MSEEKLHVIHSEDEIYNLIKYLSDKTYAAVDSETTGLSLSAEVIGISVCAEPDVAYYIITAFWDTETKQLVRIPNKEAVIVLLKVLQQKQLITQNGLVDWNWINRNYGVQLKDSTFHDAMISGHLLNENISAGLKERAFTEFGEDSVKEQQEMKQSVIDRGGIWEDKKGGTKEMFKADPYLMGKYGAKDALLTYRLFLIDVPKLYDQGLDNYFYDDESMPLFRGPTYDLNTVGLKVNVDQLNQLRVDLTKEMNELHASILHDIQPYIKDVYPGTKKTSQFNIGSSKQLAWLLFVKLQNRWNKLTDGGREVAKNLYGKVPYSDADKKRFEECLRTRTDEKGKSYKIENLIKCDKAAIALYANKYEWCKNLLKYAKAKKLLTTYVEGITEKLEYGVIHPSFRQTGTRGTRFSSNSPNFQNLPRDDKRVKSCIVSRPGKCFVGADASQIEARVFAYFSGDPELMECFNTGKDFYSVIGMSIFNKTDCTPYKEGSDEAFGVKYKSLRNVAKTAALAVCYGAEAPRLSDILNISMDEAQDIINKYWEAYPTLKKMCEKSHKEVVENGEVYSLFGRPRHLPEAKIIKKLGWPNTKLTHEYKTYLNMAVNQPIQMTSGNIINRAAIAFHRRCQEEGIEAPIVMQVHDSIIAECLIEHGPRVAEILQDCMENTTKLEGIKLEAKPLIGYNLGEV